MHLVRRHQNDVLFRDGQPSAADLNAIFSHLLAGQQAPEGLESCTGHEAELSHCPSNGFGHPDGSTTEAAGSPETETIRPVAKEGG